jgi:hypothetical protein
VIDPKTLTPEQRELWRELAVDKARPSGDQTTAQARLAQEAAFRYACALEGIPLPDVQRSSVQTGRTLQAG